MPQCKVVTLYFIFVTIVAAFSYPIIKNEILNNEDED